MMAGRDEWMEEAMTKVSPDCPPTMVDSEHPLFLLYTSGSTGKPKGVRLKPKRQFFLQTDLPRSGIVLLATSSMQQ